MPAAVSVSRVSCFMKIAVLLSGGVDSSVALRLLADEGHDLTAFYIKVWLEEEFAGLGDCPWQEDVDFARAVCQSVDVPFQVLALQQEYHDRIVAYALQELRAGRTPSPDVYCNRRIKFGAFLDAMDPSFEKVATGHYARLAEVGGRMRLFMSPDRVKDQTYFLCMVNRDRLSRILFPLGSLEKADVRQLAADYGLPTQSRKDSQGICFLGKIKYREFIRAHLGEQPGRIVEQESGRDLGGHPGYWFYTIGQREGIGLGGGPWYVVGKDVGQNVIYVSHRRSVDDSGRRRFRVAGLNWLGGVPSAEALGVKIRHGPRIEPCRIQCNGDVVEVELQTVERGLASGQFAAFYDGEECLGGGVIEVSPRAES